MKRLLAVVFALLIAGCGAYAPIGPSQMGWVNLFDGSHLNNWTRLGDANWRLQDGYAVADLGSGSGVLAIAAAKLGAARVAAIESDGDAIGNAEENVAANDVAGRVVVIEGDATVLLPLVAPVRVVLANIISAVIRDLLPVVKQSLAAEGVAIFSGMLVAESEAMRAAFEAAGFVVGADVAEGEWWSCTVHPAAQG